MKETERIVESPQEIFLRNNRIRIHDLSQRIGERGMRLDFDEYVLKKARLIETNIYKQLTETIIPRGISLESFHKAYYLGTPWYKHVFVVGLYMENDEIKIRGTSDKNGREEFQGSSAEELLTNYFIRNGYINKDLDQREVVVKPKV